MKRRIDITTTATLRPDVLNETLSTFKENLFCNDYEYRLLINVDPLGDDVTQADVVDVAQAHFDSVLARCPKEANFGKATRWLWSNVETDYFFHLEDDWKLLRPFDFNAMVGLLDRVNDIAIVRLNMFGSKKQKGTGVHVARQWNRLIPWCEELGCYEIPKELKGSLAYSGNPSLIRTAFIKPTLQYLRDDYCPEKVLKGHWPPMRIYLQKWRFCIFHQQCSKPAIKDIGRPWRSQHRWYKHRGHAFTKWEPLPDGYTENEWMAEKRKRGLGPCH